MNRKVVVNMSETKLNRLVEELTERKMRSYLQAEIERRARELTSDFLQEIKREVTFRIMDSVGQKLEFEIVNHLRDTLPQLIIKDLKENGAIEYVDEEQKVLAQIIPPNANKSSAREPLKKIIKDAKTLLIYDPYFFSVPTNYTNENYIKEIVETLPLDSLEKITIICQKQKTHVALNLFQQSLPNSVEFVFMIDNSIHDRVWLVNDTQGYLVGTSWQGIGYRLSFILPLPDEDTTEFKDWISKILSKM